MYENVYFMGGKYSFFVDKCLQKLLNFLYGEHLI